MDVFLALRSCFVSAKRLLRLLWSALQETLEQTKDESDLLLATTLEQKGKVDALLVGIQVSSILACTVQITIYLCVSDRFLIVNSSLFLLIRTLVSCTCTCVLHGVH